MLKLIIDLLHAVECKSTTENIDIAKGKYQCATSFKQFKDRLKWQLKK